MDANGRFKATFVVPQAGSYRARAVLDAPDLLPGRAATAPSVTPLPDLASGAHGIYVSLLERRLVQLHYHLVGVDDVFDYRTADAVMAFRKVQGMSRIQTVDAATWRALGAPRTFVPRDRSDGFHIEVDQTRQVLVTVRDGQAENIIHVSTGKPSTPTAGRLVPRLLEAGGIQPEAPVLPELLRRGARDPRVDRRPDVRRQPRMRADPVLGHAVDVRPGPDRDAGPHLPLTSRLGTPTSRSRGLSSRHPPDADNPPIPRIPGGTMKAGKISYAGVGVTVGGVIGFLGVLVGWFSYSYPLERRHRHGQPERDRRLDRNGRLGGRHRRVRVRWRLRPDPGREAPSDDRRPHGHRLRVPARDVPRGLRPGRGSGRRADVGLHDGRRTRGS